MGAPIFNRLLIILILTCFLRAGVAQELVVLEGKVSDAKTLQALPFSQISLIRSTVGTISNEDGRFRLVIPDSGYPDTLLISFLGYETQRVPIASFNTKVLEISLTPTAFDLKEVEIIALTPREVLKRAFDSIPVNYGVDSLILTAYIRTQKMVNNQLAEYTEAIVNNLKTGYNPYKPKEGKRKHETSNIPYLFKGRVTSDTNLVNLLGEVGANARCLGCNFVNDIAEFPYGTLLDEEVQNHSVLSMKELINPTGGKIYQIHFDQNDKTKKILHKGEILIDSRDFAIMKISYKPSYKAYDAYEKTKFNRTYFLNDTHGWIQEMPLGETTITYSKRGGAWVLGTIRRRYWVTYKHPQTRQQVKYGYKNDVVVTDITRDPAVIKEFKGNKSMGVNQRWDEIVGETDEVFWRNFNYLPIEEKLKDELDKIGK